MFAVPGWSVSSSALKTQTVDAHQPSPNPAPAAESVGSENKSKKRKRTSGKSKAADVNSTNLADLWETVIEGQKKPKQPKTSKLAEKQLTTTTDDVDTKVVDSSPVVKNDTPHQGEVSQMSDRSKQRKALKDKKREKKAQLEASSDRPEQEVLFEAKSKPTKIQQPQQPSKAVAQLTPLQAAMRQKLVSARFRHLNQTLYTTPSNHSLELFSQNPEMFQEYHEGFRRQVEVWPENPVDGYVAQIRQRGKQRGPVRGKGKTGEADEDSKMTGIIPLPRTEGTCYIADLGCGDAGLSSGLEVDKKKLKVQVFSYDLQNPSPLVTKADIANLPLEDNSVDVAIFCLALMGTNWVDFIEEAYRILRWKGELWIAEIKSRFGRVSGKKQRVEHSVGNRKKPDKKTLKKMEEDADDADLLVEVDGHDDTKQETDVSAFVEVLRKRGFVLQSEKAVDLSNRMFVKMNFVKGLTPMKGKCVPVPKGMEKMGLDTWKKKPKARFIEEEEEGPISSEASVLKPCVYKLR
jgi:ribosomal RNA-processing protein 8